VYSRALVMAPLLGAKSGAIYKIHFYHGDGRPKHQLMAVSGAHKGKQMKKCFIIAGFLSVCGMANAETYNLHCEAIGYAYNYDNEQFFESRKVSFNYKTTRGCVLDGGRSYIVNEWQSYFSSEVPDYFKYSVGVNSDCDCHDEPASGVSRKHQDFKRDFVRKNFSVSRMRGFQPEDRTF